jgi:hypothetical protein
MFLQGVIADLEKQNDSQGDVLSARQKPSARERRNIRGRRSIAKPASPVRHAAKRMSARRRPQRATQVARAHRSRLRHST